MICHESEINGWLSIVRHNEELITCQFYMAGWPRGRLYVRQRRVNVSLLRVVAAFGLIAAVACSQLREHAASNVFASHRLVLGNLRDYTKVQNKLVFVGRIQEI